jgi:hypothetical protein
MNGSLGRRTGCIVLLYFVLENWLNAVLLDHGFEFVGGTLR